MATKTYKGKIQYEFRGPNAALTDWDSATLLAPAVQLYVVSYQKSGASYVPLDSATTGAGGEFQIQFPSVPGTDDMIVFYALRTAPGNNGIAFGLAHPDVPDGLQPDSKKIPSSSETYYWQWAATKAVLTDPSNVQLTITEDLGSGAARVFDYLRYVYDALVGATGKPGKSVVVWFRPNTSWSCGACFWSVPFSSISGDTFESQMFIPAVSNDASYWSDAVTAHELGHWAMDAFGTPPGEGGPHTVGCTAYPGLAWSEGWATAHSSIARQNPLYYDKQSGSFFWFNIAAKSYSGAIPWNVPKAAQGLNQEIDENHVASMIYKLSTAVPSGQNPFPVNKYLLDALSSPLLKTPKRGYLFHTWDAGAGCAKKNVKEYKIPTPQVADFLDALVCAGYPAAKVDAVTLPATQFPYPSSVPICK